MSVSQVRIRSLTPASAALPRAFRSSLRALCCYALVTGLVVWPVAAGAGGSPEGGSATSGKPLIVVDEMVCRVGVFFDTTKHSANEVRELLRFSNRFRGSFKEIVEPIAFPYRNGLSETALEESLGRTEMRIGDYRSMLQTRPPPKVLRPVAEWIRRYIEGELWLSRRAQEYCSTGDKAALTRRYPPTGLGASCDEALAASLRAGHEHCSAVAGDWCNCMTWKGNLGVGPYPQEAWEAFLKEYGITFKILECDVP